MLFGRMYPARLRAPERSGALLFWPERYGRGRVVDRPFAEPIELPKGKRLDHLARRCALRHQAPQGGARRRRIVEHNEPTMFARGDACAQLPRRTRVRPVAERQALGRPQVGAGSMMNACNYRGFDPDRLRTPAASRGMLSAKQRVP